MDGSSLIFIIVPIAIPIALFTGVALPFIAASRSGRSHARGQPADAHQLKRINAAKRKARPPEPGAHDVPVEYLYVPCARIRDNGYPAETRRRVQEVPIAKKTAKRIYYTSNTWDRSQAVVAPAASAAKSSRPTPGATTTARGISPLAWYALRTAAATATACISWPRAGTATLLAAAGKTARQTPAACAAQSTVTRGSTAHTGRTRAVTDTRPA